MIIWLNQNQGFAMTILTSVYVIATFAIVYMNRLTIKEMEKGREEESRPYLFANLERDSRDMCFYLKIKNHGKTGCRIENISIEPNMKFVHGIILNECLPSTVIAPGQMLRFIIVEKWELTYKNNYLIEISYSETSNSKNEYLFIGFLYVRLFCHKT